MQGQHIEAHAAVHHDTASYIKFVHASLGYPSPTTFLRAVERGFITGPSQFPRLTPKAVRKYLPNAMATAKGHLDRTPSAMPHDKSDAVSARKRHHVATARTLQLQLGRCVAKGGQIQGRSVPTDRTSISRPFRMIWARFFALSSSNNYADRLPPQVHGENGFKSLTSIDIHRKSIIFPRPDNFRSKHSF